MQRGIDYVGVGVGAAIFNSEDKLFLTLRGKKAKNERGKWEIPGGNVEFGETLEDAIKREMREEHGIEEEAANLPLSIVTKYDLIQLAKKYPDGFPKF